MNNITQDTVSILIKDDIKRKALVYQAKQNQPVYNFSPDCYLEALYLYCTEKDKINAQIDRFERIMSSSDVGRSFMQQASLDDKHLIEGSVHLTALSLLLDNLDSGLKAENIIVHKVEGQNAKDNETV